MNKLKAVLAVSILISFAAMSAMSSEARISNALGWQSKDNFTTARINEGKPHLDTWQLEQNGQINQINSVELRTQTYQGYATATLANKEQVVGEYLVLFGRDGIHKVSNNTVSLLIKGQSLHSKFLDSEAFKPFPYVFDVNGDGLTDFVLPDIDNHVLWLQNSVGEFTETQLNVGLPTSMFEDENQQKSFTLSYPIATKVSDVSGNRLNDVVIAFDEGIYLFKQEQQGKFLVEPILLDLPFTLDTNMQKVQKSGRNEGYFLLQLVDINHDKIIDLVVERKTIEKDKSESQTIEFYLGQRGEGAGSLEFALSGSIELDGEMLSYGLTDFNGDNKPEFHYVSGELGAGSVMSAFFGSGFEVEIKIHQQLTGGNFTREPIKDLSTSFKLDVKNAVFGLFFKKLDINNDGIVDVLLEQGDDRLVAYYGHKKKPLEQRSKKIKIALPNEPARLQNLTINSKSYLLSLDDIKRFAQLNAVFH